MSLVGVYCEDPSLDTPEPVAWGDCLFCAGSWQNPCSMTFPLLAAIKADAEREHGWPSVSAITGCLRKSWLMQHVDWYEYPSGRMALLVGTAIHKIVEAGTELLPDVEEATLMEPGQAIAEIPVKWTTPSGLELRGTADLYYRTIRDGRHVGVLADWKSAKAIYLSKLPYGHHAAQINMYAFMLENNELELQLGVDLLQLIYVAKTGPDSRSFEHNGVVKTQVDRWTPDQARDFIINAMEQLNTAETTGTPPPGVLNDRVMKWECSYCPVRRTCDEIEQGQWTLSSSTG